MRNLLLPPNEEVQWLSGVFRVVFALPDTSPCLGVLKLFSSCVGAMDFSLQNIIGEGSVFVVDDHYDVAVA